MTSMTSDATGEYKCEVIAEHPSFRTEASGAFMTVLGECVCVRGNEGKGGEGRGNEGKGREGNEKKWVRV